MDLSSIKCVVTDPSPVLRWLEVAGIWFTGLATIGVVFVAWSFRRFWERRQRPLLSLGHDTKSQEDCRYIPPVFASGPPSVQDQSDQDREELWVRLHVNNKSKTVAKNVQLRVISIERERKGTPDNRPKWWFKASNLDSTSITIHPQLPEHFDIAYVRNIIGIEEDISFFLVLVPQGLQPWKHEKKRIEEDVENNLLEVGWMYTMHLALLGDNIDAKHYELKFKVDSLASEDRRPKEQLGEKEMKKRVHVISLNEKQE